MENFTVILSPALVAEIEKYPELDQDDMLAFVQQLRRVGLDLILDARINLVPGVDVEFIEPSESPALLWARIFLQLQERSITLRIHVSEQHLFLEKG